MPVAAKTVPFASKPQRTEFSVLLSRARELQPAVRAAARDTETNRRVSKKTMDLLREAELTKLVRPARFGGFEYGTSEMAQIAFELGRACGSTGWCGSLAMCYQWMMSFFTLEAQQDVLGDPDNLVAGSYQPSKEVEIVPGGIKLAGAWPYASNCENSQWLMLGAGLPNAKGPPDVMWCLVPIADMKVDQDTWFTSGLQGTGSKTVRIERPVFVPEHRMLRFAEIVAGTVPGKQIEDNDMSKFGFTTFGPTALVSPVLGMAQGALDCFIEMAKTKVRAAKPGMIVPMAASPMIQNKIGVASATVEFGFHASLEQRHRRRSQGAQRHTAHERRAHRHSPQSGFCRKAIGLRRQRSLRQGRRRWQRSRRTVAALLARCERGRAASVSRLGADRGDVRPGAARA